MSSILRTFLLLGFEVRRGAAAGLALAIAVAAHAANPVPFTEGVSFSFRISGVGNGLMTVYAEGSTTIGHTTYNATTESDTATAWLRPGKEYRVNFQASGPSDYWLSYVVPQGYVLLIEDAVSNLTYANPGGGWYSHDYTVELRPIGDMASAPYGEFMGVQMGKSVSWEIGLGSLTTGRSAGRLYFKEYHLGADPASRAKVYYSPPGNYGEAWVFRDGPSTQQVRQITLTQGVVDLLDDPAGGFWIRFFLQTQSEGSPGNPNILRGSPWKTIRVESPGPNQLRITETEGATVRVSLVTAPQPASGAYEWTLQEGGAGGDWLRTTKHTSVQTSTSGNPAAGGTISTSGSHTVHTFASSGTFTVGTPIVGLDAVLVGGGGGGGQEHAGGGGAGGVLQLAGVTVGPGTYNVAIGEGGAGGIVWPYTGTNGGNTTALGYAAYGGGAGTGMPQYGNFGGSGGGDGYPSGGVQGGDAYAGQGNTGSRGNSQSVFNGGGGGGAGGPGSGAYGGAPLSTWAGTFAGGGGGGYAGGPGGGAGAGNGGNGAAAGGHAPANTGSGGGGGGNMGASGGNGGSGIVVIRYPSVVSYMRDVRVEVRTGGGAGEVVSKQMFRYENVGGWGEEVTKIFAYPTLTTTDANALVTTFAYHTDASAKGNFRRIKSITQPDGGWVAQAYFDDWERRGQLQNEFRPFVDAPATVTMDPALGRVKSFDYGPDWTGRRTRPTLSQERVGGVMTAQTGYANDNVVGQGWAREFTNIFPWSSATAYVMEHTQVYRGDAGFDLPGLPYVQKRADLSQISSSYSGGYWNGTTFSTTAGIGWWREIAVNGSQSSADGAQSVSSWDGQTFEPLYLTPNKSTLSVVIRRAGMPIRRESYVYTGAGQFSLLTWENLTYDNQWRLTQKTDSSGATSDYGYAGGRLESVTDAAGIVTRFGYDALGRVLWERKDGANALTSTLTSGYDYKAQPALYTHFVRDALGRVRESIVTTSATKPAALGVSDLKATTEFDLAGRPTSSKSNVGSAHELSSGYNYHEPADRKTTFTFPGGATKVVETHRDGLVRRVTGTGVVQEDFNHVIMPEGRYFRQSFFGANFSAWTNSYFDWLGRPAEEWKPGWNGNAVARTWSYNSRGQLWKTTAPGANPTLFEYDTLGAQIRQGLDVNNNGTLDLASQDRITETTYSLLIDGLGRASRQTTTRTYATDGNGSATTTAIQTELLSNLGANVLRAATTIDIFGNPTYTAVTVDRAAKKLVSIVNPPDSTTDTINVTHNGLAVEQQDFAGLRTRTEYDSLGRPEKTIVPRVAATVGAQTTSYLPRTNLVDKVTDPAGVVTATYAYDAAGRVRSVQDAAGKFAHTAYTARGEVLRQWGDTVSPVEFAYNGAGQRTAMKTYRGGTGWTQSDWPGTGANTSGSTGTADTTLWVYHEPTRLLGKKTYPAADPSSPSGELNTAHSVDYTYTQAGQISTREWARLNSSGARVKSTYAYAAATGELAGLTYNDGTPALNYTYNRLGATATTADATGTRSFNYALSGKLELQSEDLPAYFSSRRISYPRASAGVIGRPVGVQLGTSANPTLEQSVSWDYDAYGRFNNVTAGGVALAYTYTTNSHLLSSISDSVSGWTQSRTYLPNRDLLDVIEGKVGATSVAKFDYGHDALGRRTSVRKTSDAGATLFSRYGNGTEGLKTKFGYDDRSQVTSEGTWVGESEADTAKLTGRADAYAYDQFGNRGETAGTTHNAATANYATNALNQYTARTVPRFTDVAGAATAGTTVTVNGSNADVARSGQYYFKRHPLANSNDAAAAVFATLTVSDGVTTPDQSLKTFLPATPEPFSYDRDGNLTSDGRWAYTYDAENRLVAMQTRSTVLGSAPLLPSSEARRLEFTYDYLGRRVRTIVRAGWDGTVFATVVSDLKFLYDGWNLIAELGWSSSTSSWNLNRSYVWGLDWSGSLQGAGGVGGLLMIQEGGATFQPHYDGNGNLMGLTTRSAVTFGSETYAAGALVAAYEYDAFGQTIRESGPYAASNSFRFSTKYTDLDTGLAYYGLRYYSPSLGRFINRDPSEEKGGLNLYAFVKNNSINEIDYLGLDIVFGTRNGAERGDSGHVFVGVITGNTVTRFDWYATGGASGLNYGQAGGWTPLGSGDASVRITTISLDAFTRDLASRSDISLFKVSTTAQQDVAARTQMLTLRDLASESTDDTLYNAAFFNCGDASVSIIQAAGATSPASLISTPQSLTNAASSLAATPNSGWTRFTAPGSTPSAYSPTFFSSGSPSSSSLSSSIAGPVYGTVTLAPFTVTATVPKGTLPKPNTPAGNGTKPGGGQQPRGTPTTGGVAPPRPSIPGATVITDPDEIAAILGSLGGGADAFAQDQLRRILEENEQ